MQLAVIRSSTAFRLLFRAVVVWLLIIAAEMVHGILRAILLVPLVGEFRSSQIGVFTGSLIILAITWFFIRWIGTRNRVLLLAVGVEWAVLTIGFEWLFGRYVMHLSWQRLATDYNLMAGGLMPIGLVVVVLAPLVAARLRTVTKGS